MAVDVTGLSLCWLHVMELLQSLTDCSPIFPYATIIILLWVGIIAASSNAYVFIEVFLSVCACVCVCVVLFN